MVLSMGFIFGCSKSESEADLNDNHKLATILYEDPP
jgi:hypothetical protein